MPTDRQPLLPTHSNSNLNPQKGHMNHSSSSRLSSTRISFPSSSTSALGPRTADDGEDDEETFMGSTSTLSPPSSKTTKPKYRGWSADDTPLLEGGGGGTKKPGVPKLSRECLISEIKCYGSYMLPPLLVFGVLAIGISLGIYGWKRGWFS
ncbi:uncharacterized protein I303_102941 [Kwoniella dejecticola CBS 10117]|uniref:Uncharacterized protein n=1 Tax=Kwoniella dejecticola CBS 10117 TaxID=1296121 RepID=A0A1A6AA54_9TREE|nr:uncharacterized protein I303_02960 [Kwoniella dejecticola CBS 10117]OBR86939.1 hypothetical protein I303_02960 [Kwoniella dejecticola CBS 10117]